MSLIHGMSTTNSQTPVRVSAAGAVEITSTTLTNVEDLAEKSVYRTASTMVNGADIFTVAGGPIQIISIGCVCITANDATASTLQYRADGTDGAATTITGASASLANAAAGTIVVSVPGTLATAPAVYANGVGIAGTVGIIVPAGIIEIVVGVGSTTGTWRQFIRYVPLATGVTVTAA